MLCILYRVTVETLQCNQSERTNGSIENEDPENEDPKTEDLENEDPYENEDPIRKRRPPTKTKTPYENGSEKNRLEQSNHYPRILLLLFLLEFNLQFKHRHARRARVIFCDLKAPPWR